MHVDLRMFRFINPGKQDTNTAFFAAQSYQKCLNLVFNESEQSLNYLWISSFVLLLPQTLRIHIILTSIRSCHGLGCVSALYLSWDVCY